jgi:hypothetical protein
LLERLDVHPSSSASMSASVAARITARSSRQRARIARAKSGSSRAGGEARVAVWVGRSSDVPLGGGLA